MAHHFRIAYLRHRTADYLLAGTYARPERGQRLISARFAVQVSAILMIVLVPTIIHDYMRARADDGRVVDAIDNTLVGMASKPKNRRAEWVKETFDSDDWIERRYTGTEGSEVLLFVARSYDLK